MRPQRGIIELARTKVLKYGATRKTDKTTKGGVLKLWRNPQRGIIGLAGTGVALQAMSAAFLEREERPSGHLFFFHSKLFLSTFIEIILVSTPARFRLPTQGALSTCGEKRSRVERQLSHGSV